MAAFDGMQCFLCDELCYNCGVLYMFNERAEGSELGVLHRFFFGFCSLFVLFEGRGGGVESGGGGKRCGAETEMVLDPDIVWGV